MRGHKLIEGKRTALENSEKTVGENAGEYGILAKQVRRLSDALGTLDKSIHFGRHREAWLQFEVVLFCRGGNGGANHGAIIGGDGEEFYRKGTETHFKLIRTYWGTRTKRTSQPEAVPRFFKSHVPSDIRSLRENLSKRDVQNLPVIVQETTGRENVELYHSVLS